MDVSQILEPWFYLGDQACAYDAHWYKEKGVVAVVNCTKDEALNKHESAGVAYFRVPARDNPGFGNLLANNFNDATKFILEHKAKGSVLVHCSAGMSRSPTIVLAYLIIGEKMTLRQAVVHVKSKRAVMPQDRFLGKLVELDLQTHGANSIQAPEIIEILSVGWN